MNSIKSTLYIDIHSSSTQRNDCLHLVVCNWWPIEKYRLKRHHKSSQYHDHPEITRMHLFSYFQGWIFLLGKSIKLGVINSLSTEYFGHSHLRRGKYHLRHSCNIYRLCFSELSERGWLVISLASRGASRLQFWIPIHLPIDKNCDFRFGCIFNAYKEERGDVRMKKGRSGQVILVGFAGYGWRLNNTENALTNATVWIDLNILVGNFNRNEFTPKPLSEVLG